jgi:hypothetical protein
MSFFPYRSSWIQAAKLYLVAYIGVVVLTAFFWFFVLTGAISILFNGAEFLPFFLAVSIGALIAGFVFYQCLRLVYWLILKVLWSKPPQWLKQSGFRASLHSFSILTVATLPLAIVCYLPMFIDLYTKMETSRYVAEYQDLTTPSLMWFSWLWLIASAYLYQWFPLRRRQ